MGIVGSAPCPWAQALYMATGLMERARWDELEPLVTTIMGVAHTSTTLHQKMREIVTQALSVEGINRGCVITVISYTGLVATKLNEVVRCSMVNG